MRNNNNNLNRRNQKKKHISKKKSFIPTNFDEGVNKLNNKAMNINIKVNLENIYNKDIRVANINVYIPCSLCNGDGVIKNDKFSVDENVRRMISKNKNTKKNIDYSKCKLCEKCNGRMRENIIKKYIIDTSLDKICYVNENFISNDEGYKDIIFNIIQKEHPFIKKKDRYDLQIDQDISLYEYYYGGEISFKFLDNLEYTFKYNKFNNGKLVNNIIKENMGLIINCDNCILSENDSLLNVDKIHNRGNLIINFNLKLPIFDYHLLQLSENNIKNLFENHDDDTNNDTNNDENNNNK